MLQKRSTWLLIIIASAAAGTIPAFSKIALTGMNAGSLTISRYVYTFVAILLFAAIFKEPLAWKNIWRTLPLSLLAALNAICFAIGIQFTPASSVQLLYVWLPMFIAFLSWRILRQHIHLNQIIGMTVGLLGILIVILGPLMEQGKAIAFQPVGVGVILFGGLMFSFYSVISKTALKTVTPTELLISTSFATIGLQTLYMLVTHEPLIIPSAASPLMGSLVVGLIGTAFNYWIFQYIIKVSSPISASMVQYIMPVFGALFAYIVLADAISPFAVFGGIVAIAGAIEVSVGWKKLINKSHNYKL